MCRPSQTPHLTLSAVQIALLEGIISIEYLPSRQDRTEIQNQASFSPFSLHEISVLIELTLGHLRYGLTDVPPQPNSQPDYVVCTGEARETPLLTTKPARWRDPVLQSK